MFRPTRSRQDGNQPEPIENGAGSDLCPSQIITRAELRRRAPKRPITAEKRTPGSGMGVEDRNSRRGDTSEPIPALGAAFSYEREKGRREFPNGSHCRFQGWPGIPLRPPKRPLSGLRRRSFSSSYWHGNWSAWSENTGSEMDADRDATRASLEEAAIAYCPSEFVRLRSWNRGTVTLPGVARAPGSPPIQRRAL